MSHVVPEEGLMTIAEVATRLSVSEKTIRRYVEPTPERRVFQGITEGSTLTAMRRACRDSGIPHYTPHDLRHRRISLWHASGVPARELAERAGHAKASMSLDIYSHVMPPDEVAEKGLAALLEP